MKRLPLPLPHGGRDRQRYLHRGARARLADEHDIGAEQRPGQFGNALDQARRRHAAAATSMAAMTSSNRVAAFVSLLSYRCFRFDGVAPTRCEGRHPLFERINVAHRRCIIATTTRWQSCSVGGTFTVKLAFQPLDRFAPAPNSVAAA